MEWDMKPQINSSVCPIYETYDKPWPGTTAGYISVQGQSLLLFAASMVAWFLLARKSGVKFREYHLTQTSCNCVPNLALAIVRTVFALAWNILFISILNEGAMAPCLHRYFTLWTLMLTALYFTLAAMISWLHILRPRSPEDERHMCLTVTLHLLLSNGLNASLFTALIFQFFLAPTMGLAPFGLGQGGRSYFNHLLVAVIWCVDFGLSAMPLPAVHCFGCLLTCSAYMFCNLVIENMRADPPYFFLDATKAGSGVWVFGLFLMNMILYFTCYAFWICCKRPTCGCHYKEACATLNCKEETEAPAIPPNAASHKVELREPGRAKVVLADQVHEYKPDAVKITVPNNVKPGDSVSFSWHKRMFKCVIPEDTESGMRFVVNLSHCRKHSDIPGAD